MDKINKANNIYNQNNFFNKKRITIFLILTIIMITLSVIISIFLLDIDSKKIVDFFIQGFQKNNLFFLWIFLLIFFSITLVIWSSLAIGIRIKKEGFKIKWWDILLLSFMRSFINGITPFASGSEAYLLFWLKSKGIETKKALVILSANGFFWTLTQVVITWPSFFIISSLYNQYKNSIPWITIYWISFSGLIFDLIAFFSIFAIAYSKRIHFILNSIYYWFRKKIRLTYKSKEEIKNKYLEKETFRIDFLNEIKNYKYYSFLFIGNIFWNIIIYSSMYFSFKISVFNFSNDPNFYINYSNWFNYTNVSVTANNWVPIPGAEGTLQLSIITFLGSIIPNPSKGFEDEIVNIVFIWRLFIFYLPIVIGLFCFPVTSFIFFKRYKRLS